MRSRWLAAVILAAMVCGGSLAADQGKGKGKDKNKSAGDQIREVLPPSEAVFTVEERQVVTTWYRNRGKGLPPGLAKKDRLPPGLEKQLRERGTLPPGLQKKVHPLPIELERQLRVLPTGYRRVAVGGNIILMNRKTALVYDIIRLVIP